MNKKHKEMMYVILTIDERLKSASTYLPQATTFTNTAGEVARYYFKNNPWKFSDANRFQKIFRFCVICGDNRFSDEKW